MKKKKQQKKWDPKDPEPPVTEPSETIPPPQKEKVVPEYYSYTKSGSMFNLAVAAFFALTFLVPGLCVSLNADERSGGFVCICLGLFPLYFALREIYSKKVSLTKKTLRFEQHGIFMKKINWEEPLEYYFRIAEDQQNDETHIVLWHSSDDFKNALLYSSWYKEYHEIEEKTKDLSYFLRHTEFGKKQKYPRIGLPKDYNEQNFFEVYNHTKVSNHSWKQLLFPDRHVKILRDEPDSFITAVNKGLKIFIAGLTLLTLSFLMLPIVYKIGGVAFWCVVFHISGVGLYCFGVSEQVIKIEKRSLIIGNRYFKSRIHEQFSIPVAEILSVEVAKPDPGSGKEDDNWLLKIRAENGTYEFGQSPQKEELDWLSKTITSRALTISEKYIDSLQGSVYDV
ncbi:MAG: hypothetical protein ACJ77K_13835 [Bacteroidia bacterium]